MSTLDSSSSGKKVVKVKVIVSSEVRQVLYLSDLSFYEDRKHSPILWVIKANKGGAPNAIYSANLVKFTFSDVYRLIKKVDDLLMNTVRGMDSKLEELFGRGNNNPREYRPGRGTPMGTIHIYAPDLISWYDGKNWHKLTLDE